MKPIDFRNESFTGLRSRLSALRREVWIAWLAYEERDGTAGATTREVANAAHIDILTFRPRSTELYQMGVLAVAEPNPAAASSPGGEDTGEGGPQTGRRSEGLYRTRPLDEWEAWHAEQVQAAISGQQQLI